MVSTCPLISLSFIPFDSHSVTVPRAPITIHINITTILHSFSIPLLGLGICFSFHFLSILLYGQLGQQNEQFRKFSIFVDHYMVRSSDRDLVIFVCQNPRGVRVSFFSRADAGLYIYHLFIWSNINFWHNSLWIF